jgi:methylenetetrahydrofolate dehydrogenase (NADP+)/methenyltetrahydrofolate cyclohydrolase
MIIDGKKMAREIEDELAREIKDSGLAVTIATVLVGEDPASDIYVQNKEKACSRVGIAFQTKRFPADISEEDLFREIDGLNVDPQITGILIQLPLPKHIDPSETIALVSPSKDIDGFHPLNMGKLLRGEDAPNPCTPLGVMVMLEKSGIDVTGKDATVVGRSNIVGKPLSIMLTKKNATVTMCHTRTRDLRAHTRNADIIIAAAGSPRLIKGDMVKDGAVVIDVGMNRTESGLCGDVDFDAVKDKVSWITPVPGGVGPMTIAMLLKNSVYLAKATQAGRATP